MGDTAGSSGIEGLGLGGSGAASQQCGRWKRPRSLRQRGPGSPPRLVSPGEQAPDPKAFECHPSENKAQTPFSVLCHALPAPQLPGHEEQLQQRSPGARSGMCHHTASSATPSLPGQQIRTAGEKPPAWV